MTREEQKAEFTYKLGLILGPVMRAIDRPLDHSEPERRQVRGRFTVDAETFHNDLNGFCHGEPGVRYSAEWQEICNQFNGLRHLIDQHLVALPHPPHLKDGIHEAARRLVAAIAAVPTPGTSEIFDAHTPFTSYLRLKALCEGSVQKVVCVDRYLDETIFHRQLSGVPQHVEITLVTWQTALTNAFRDISRLFAAERGVKYRLMTDPSFHDRWLRCDGQLFVLGGSIKHAGCKSVYTVARSAFPDAEMAKVDQLIANATEVFGPTNPVHP